MMKMIMMNKLIKMTKMIMMNKMIKMTLVPVYDNFNVSVKDAEDKNTDVDGSNCEYIHPKLVFSKRTCWTPVSQCIAGHTALVF